MTKKQEKVWGTLKKIRDRLEKLATDERTGFFTKEDQKIFMECANTYSDCARSIDYQMQKISTGDSNLTEIDAMRNRLKEWNF